MRFFITPDIRRNTLLRQIILWSLVFLAVFWLSNWPFYLRIGLAPEAIATYYRGSEEAFRPPRSFFGLLEETHFHAFAMLLLLMTFGHLVLFTRAARWIKAIIVHTTFTGALLDMAGGWLIRYVHPAFAYVKIAAFLVLQTGLLVILILLASYLREPAETRESGRQ